VACTVSSLCNWCSLFQAIVKALDELTRANKIKEKVYGKQKVYVADQVIFYVHLQCHCVYTCSHFQTAHLREGRDGVGEVQPDAK
jgi:hypothetical protein